MPDTIDQILITPERAERLRRDEKTILSMASASACLGDETLRLHLNAVQMANELKESQENAADACDLAGAPLSAKRHASLALKAEQLRLHHLNALSTWLNGR